MAEGIWIVERDRNQTASGGTPVLWGGPYASEIEAQKELPEDQDGIEYTIEWLDSFDVSQML